MFRSSNEDLCPIMRSCKFSDESEQFEHLQTCALCLMYNAEFNFHGVQDGLQEFVSSFLIQSLIEALNSLKSNKVLLHS